MSDPEKKKTSLSFFFNLLATIFREVGFPRVDLDMVYEMRVQSFYSKLLKKLSAEDTLVPPLWEKRGGGGVINCGCSCGCTRRNLYFHVQNGQQADRKQLT